MSEAVEPFVLSIPQETLDDLDARLAMTRWPEAEPVDDWSQGVPIAEMRALVDYWRGGYDWRACEKRMNDFGSFRTTIDGLDLHFLHVRSPHDDALPLIMTHGWPGSVREFFDVIPMLTDPEKHGGSADQAFHLVLPSLPGYGFSGKPGETGWNVDRIADAWATLMARLGYDRWVAQGGDWGAVTVQAIGVKAPKGCIGLHSNLPFAPPPTSALNDPTDEDAKMLGALQAFQQQSVAHALVQGTVPQTIGYSFVDSPVGQAAWIFNKMLVGTDNDGSPYDALSRDAILDNIMFYWLPGAGASSSRLYWESFAMAEEGPTIDLPFAVSQFPAEVLKMPRSWCEQVMTNIVYWNETDRGGHFPAWEQPALFVDELRAGFAPIRQ